MWECRVVSPLLWDYSADKLPKEQVERVERHLSRCPSCAKSVEEYRKTYEAIHAFKEEPVPASKATWYEMRMLLQAPETPSQRSFHRRPPVFPLAAAGAGMLCALIVAAATGPQDSMGRILPPIVPPVTGEIGTQKADSSNATEPQPVRAVDHEPARSVIAPAGGPNRDDDDRDRRRASYAVVRRHRSRGERSQRVWRHTELEPDSDPIAEAAVIHVPGVMADQPLTSEATGDFVMNVLPADDSDGAHQFVMDSIPDSGTHTATPAASSSAGGPVW